MNKYVSLYRNHYVKAFKCTMNIHTTLIPYCYISKLRKLKTCIKNVQICNFVKKNNHLVLPKRCRILKIIIENNVLYVLCKKYYYFIKKIFIIHVILLI